MCGEINDLDIIAQLKQINRAEDCLSGEEENKKIQEKFLPIAAEDMMQIHELQRFS